MLGVWLTAERGTDSAALATALEDAMQKLTAPSFNQDTDSLQAISDLVDLIPTTAMRGTDSAATAIALSAVPTTMVGTDNAALAADILVPTADVVTNANIRDVVGNKSDAAGKGDNEWRQQPL